MANINKNIVETRKLASKGRYGDNMIREIDEAPAHVNAYEAYLLDRYGDAGEEAVKDIGAGTTNPETGMKEYHGSMLGGMFGKPKGHPLHHIGIKQIAGKVSTWDKGWHQFFPSQGTGWFSKTPSDERQAATQAAGIVNIGMEGLLKQQEQYMGPEGFLTEEQRLEEEGIGSAYGQSMRDITSERDKLISGTNLAYSGEIEEKIGDAEDMATDKYTSQMELSGLKAEKTEVDFMANLRKQMNQMMIDYQSAAGKPYAGGEAMTELNQIFSSYYGDEEDV